MYDTNLHRELRKLGRPSEGSTRTENGEYCTTHNTQKTIDYRTSQYSTAATRIKELYSVLILSGILQYCTVECGSEPLLNRFTVLKMHFDELIFLPMKTENAKS